MKKQLLIFLTLILALSLVNISSVKASGVEEKVKQLMDTMTLQQKVGQMIQADTRSINPQNVKDNYIGSILSGGGAAPSTGNTAKDWAERLDEFQKAAIDGFGIPLLYGVDAVHGNNNVKDATIFPHNVGLGQANDTELMKSIAQITAKEMRATGANWTFTPTLGLPKNERWGRTNECFGEDAALSARLGTAYIEGSQGNLGKDSAIATAKHFIGEGIAKDGVNQGDVPLDYDSQEFQDILYNELIIPYKDAIKAGVKSVMVTYNSINGIKCHGNKILLTDLLKDELGFKGIVISDYNGIDQIDWNISYKEKVVKAVNAGIDMLMVDGNEGNEPKWAVAIGALIDGVNNKQIEQSRIDDAVKRILTVKFEMGLIDNPQLAYSDQELLKSFGSKEHREVARDAVRKSLTLLKNTKTNNDSTIMNDLKNMENIVVAGSSADDIGMQCGGWTMSWQGSEGNITAGTTIFSGLKEVANKNATIDYSANGYFSNDDYQAAIVVCGDKPYAEYAGDRSASELRLSATDINTINRIKKDHPDLPIIAVLTSGRPITIADQIDKFDAVVMAGLPGSEGAGIADVLLGDYDFNGKLTYTWPWYAEDIEDKFSDPSKVMFEFGRGLKKAEVTDILTGKPIYPLLIDLSQTNGIIEAEKFISKHNEIVLENDGTSIGHFWVDRDISYKVKIPENARYTFITNSATEYNDIKVALKIYVDDKLYYTNSTPLPNTGGWAKFIDLEMDEKISLPEGEHTIKFVSQARDFNVDKFKFIKFDDQYTEPDDNQNQNEGAGAIIKENAVNVTMSSSEHSQEMAWYKGEFEIENKNSSKKSLDIRNTDSSDMTTISINSKKEYQDILGIGTSIEESTINNLLKMSDVKRKAFIKRLLDPKDGMGNSLIRVTIGTSDFTGQDFYTYYEGTGKELDGKPDWYNTTGKGFSIQKDRDFGIIKVIKEIQEIAKELGVEKDLRFFASSWTPPGWMKLPTTSSNSYSDNDKLLKGGKLNDSHIENLAKYYIRYLEEYKKEGIQLYAMTLQNEPLLEINYPSCAMTGTQEAKLARAIKDELAKSTILNEQEKDVKVWAFDHNFDGADAFVNELFADQEGYDSVDGLAFHPYGGTPSTMGSMYEQYKDKTMHLTERSVWGTSGANDIIEWFRNGSKSYNGWVTMLDSNVAPHQWVGTPDPTMFVQDAHNRERYWATPEVYIIGQFSKYIRPGFIRIDSNNGEQKTLTNVAFKNPETGEIIMVATNRSGIDQAFKVVMDGTQFNATLPAGNTATYIWNPVNATEFKNITDDLTLEDATLTGSGEINNGELGKIDNTTSLNYLVNIKQAGTYRVVFGVAAGGDKNKALPVEISANGEILGKANAKRYNTWNTEWSSYNKIQTYVTFKETGIQTFSLKFPEGGLNFKDVQFYKEEAVQSLPGILDVNNYFTKLGLVYEGNNFGFSARDEYIDYKVNVQVAGTYLFTFDIASNSDGAGVWIDSLNSEGASTFVGEIDFGHTGGTDSYQLKTKDMKLAAGEQTLRIKFKSDNCNFKNVVIGNGISVASDILKEGELTDKKVLITLNTGEFINFLDKDAFKMNLPKGLNYEVSRKDDKHVGIIFKDVSSVDFDNDLEINLEVLASQYNGLEGTSLKDNFMIQCVDDEEELKIDSSITFNTKKVTLKLAGGTFKEKDIKNMITLSSSASRYVSIQEVEYKSKEEVELTLEWKAVYGDVKGIITLAKDGYDDSDSALTVETIFKATIEKPTAIPVENNKVSLNESKSYRNEGSLKTDAKKGNYIDFYLDIPTAGDYLISYKVKNNQAVTNGLKVSGGLGLATDNLASVSFSNFWDNQVGYKNKLTLKQGEQTLRFELNAGGFTIDVIEIEKVKTPICIEDKTVITVDDLIDGSKNIGWGIETKDNIHNIGCGMTGSYQDYLIDVKETGIYTFSILSGTGSGSIPMAIVQSIENNEVKELGKVAVSKTNDWSVFKDSDEIEIKLKTGKQIIRIFDDVDGFNYRSFTLTKVLDKKGPTIEGKNTSIYINDKRNQLEILGININDDFDGDISLDSQQIEVISDYDKTKPGDYTVTIKAKDKAGNVTEKIFNIKVVNDAYIKAKHEIVKLNDKFDLMGGVSAYDIDDSDITNKVKVVDSNLDMTKKGVYQIKYSVVDKLGTTVSFVRNITVISKSSIKNDQGIVIEVDGGELNPDTQLVSETIEDEELLKNISNQIMPKDKLLKIIDFRLMLSNQELDLKDKSITLRIPISEDMEGYSTFKIAYIKDGKIVEYHYAEVVNGYLVFKTSHLSLYAIIAENVDISVDVNASEDKDKVSTNDNSYSAYYMTICVFAIAVLILCKKRKKETKE